MIGDKWMISPDVHFGIACAGKGPLEFGASPIPGLTTVELPFGAWAGTLASAPALLRGFSDLCIRLGEDFVGPAEGRFAEGGPAATGREAAYVKAVARCRRLMEKPWAKAAITALLIEFPVYCPYGTAARWHLDRVTKDLSGLPLAVAFYGADWYSARVIEGLKARGIALCLLDMPKKLGSSPSIDVVTSSLVYLKLNDRTDLLSWLPRLEALAAQATQLRVIFSVGGDNGEVAAAASAALMAELWAGLSRGASSKRADFSAGGP